MMDDHDLDQAVCGSCKHLFAKKDRIIDDLKENLKTYENRVQNLENEVKNFEKQMKNVLTGIWLIFLQHYTWITSLQCT